MILIVREKTFYLSSSALGIAAVIIFAYLYSFLRIFFQLCYDHLVNIIVQKSSKDNPPSQGPIPHPFCAYFLLFLSKGKLPFIIL